MKNALLASLFFLVLSACRKPSCPIPEQETEPETIDTTTTNPPPPEVKTINSWALKSNGISGFLAAVDFPTPTTGYISGMLGVVYKTINGGESYQDISLMTGYDSYALDFVSENTGYMVNNSSNVDGKVFKTTDGGQNWVEQTIPPHMWRCVKFHNKNIGFVGGGIINYTQGGSGKLYKTTNGGQNWTEITSISDLKIIRNIFFVNSNVIFLTTDRARVYKSTDGGNTWILKNHTINTFIDSIYLSPQALYFKNHNEGYCLTNGLGIVGVGTFMTKTMDGGETWSEVSLPPSGYSTFNYYYSLVFTSYNVGYLCGGNVAENKASILKTINGGNDWIQTPIDCPRLMSMSVVNDALAYSVGSNSTVLKSAP